VREQDEAAARVSNQLNANVAQANTAAQGQDGTSDELLRAGIAIDARDPNRMIVERVLPGTAAMRAGLRPGDVITRVNGSPVTSLTAVAQALLSGNGNSLALQVDRNGQSRQLNLSMPDNSVRTAMRPNQANPAVDGQLGANQGAVTVGGVPVPGTAVGAAGARGNAGITPGLGNITAQSAGGQAVAAGQPAGVGLGTATAPGQTTADQAATTLSGATSQPTTGLTATAQPTTGSPTPNQFPASAATQGNPTSPGLLVQPDTATGLPTSTPGIPTSVPGLPTSTQGVAPSTTGNPGTSTTGTAANTTTGSSQGASPVISSSQGGVIPGIGGGFNSGSTTSGVSTASGTANNSSQGTVTPGVVGGAQPGGTGGAASGTGAAGTSSTGSTSAAGTTGVGGASASGGTTGAAGAGSAGGGAAAGGT
jgi:membrane-associated protease RseP (regulator of RpoE activity)